MQELASGFKRGGFGFIFPCDHFVHHCDLESRIDLPRPSSPNKYCIVYLCVLYLHFKDTLPASSMP